MQKQLIKVSNEEKSYSLMPGGNKRSYVSNKPAGGMFKYVPPGTKELNSDIQ